MQPLNYQATMCRGSTPSDGIWGVQFFSFCSFALSLSSSLSVGDSSLAWLALTCFLASYHECFLPLTKNVLFTSEFPANRLRKRYPSFSACSFLMPRQFTAPKRSEGPWRSSVQFITGVQWGSAEFKFRLPHDPVLQPFCVLRPVFFRNLWLYSIR
jgi:hypothetical protein